MSRLVDGYFISLDGVVKHANDEPPDPHWSWSPRAFISSSQASQAGL